MSADSSDVSSYSALTELHQFPPSEPPLALLQIGVAETGMSRLEGRARRRVLSVANLLHKPAGISATSGGVFGDARGLGQAKPLARCGVKHHDFTPLAQRLFMALSQNLPMNLLLAASYNPSPAVRLSHRRSCDSLRVRICTPRSYQRFYG